MKIEKKNDIDIVVFAFRYALGRKTAASFIVINTIKDLWDSFELIDKELIISETKTHIKLEYDEVYSIVWVDFLEWCGKRIRDDKITTLFESH